METSSSQSVYDFLDKMRNPASVDLVRSIKSFIVSFSFYTANPENDGKRLQDFLLTMEATIRDHSLWIGAIEEEIDSAIEGLEKYVMTKLFSRTFASSLDDAKMDQDISDKICLLQTFLRPEHLDIPTAYQNEASWLLAVKELQKINAFKAPREKLCCILNCCRVINNLLLNASFSEDHVPGADDFLPVLIYVAIKISPSTALSLSFVGDVNSLMLFESRKHLKRSVLANPPQLHSNLKFIQLYRRQEKLISEAAYYFTNLVSAKSFIVDLDAKSLSMEEPEFLESMQRARLAVRGTQIERPPALVETTPLSGSSTRMNNKVIQTQPLPMFGKTATLAGETDPWHSITGGSSYPFMEAEAGELTVGDVERLLSLYKDVVNKYTSLHRAFRHTPIPEIEPPLPHSEESNIVLIQSGEKM